MKAGKALGPSGIVVEMIRAVGDTVPPWSVTSQLQSFAMARYPLTGSRVSLSASTRVRGMHWKGETNMVSSWQSRSWKSWRELLTASSDSWCQSLCPGQTHNRRNLFCKIAHEEYLVANKRLYMAFVDLEKAFDCVPQTVIWWGLRKLGVEEWIVRLVQGMYANALSRVCVGEGYSEEFEVKVSVHQGSVLNLLLFFIVLEALSHEFCSGVPWEDHYANDFVIIAESLEECVRRLLTWKEAMQEKGLRVNAEKTKIMICGMGLDLFRWVSICHLSHWSGQQQHPLQQLQVLGAQEMQWVQVLDKGPWLQMYMVPVNCMPLGWQTTEGSPS